MTAMLFLALPLFVQDEEDAPPTWEEMSLEIPLLVSEKGEELELDLSKLTAFFPSRAWDYEKFKVTHEGKETKELTKDTHKYPVGRILPDEKVVIDGYKIKITLAAQKADDGKVVIRTHEILKSTVVSISTRGSKGWNADAPPGIEVKDDKGKLLVNGCDTTPLGRLFSSKGAAVILVKKDNLSSKQADPLDVAKAYYKYLVENDKAKWDEVIAPRAKGSAEFWWKAGRRSVDDFKMTYEYVKADAKKSTEQKKVFIFQGMKDGKKSGRELPITVGLADGRWLVEMASQ